MTDPLRIAFLLFPDMTQLDLTGPAQFLARIGRVDYVAATRDPVPTDAGFAILPTASYDEVPAADILCIPGGMGVGAVIDDDAAMAWVAQVGGSAQWVTSVCTGSLILGAAGLLEGYRATSHWAWRHLLPLFGAEAVEARIMVDRNRVTGGGVTAGIDVALTLIAEVKGEQTAKLLQLAFEYDPAPPFDAGSPVRADAATLALYDRQVARIAPPRDADLRAAALRRGFS
jgi:cyclohexyl-isocyanide hydratase